MEANKPTNPQIKIKCDECNGTSEITSGREEATGTEPCGKCDDGAIDAAWDSEGAINAIGMYGSLFSDWGTEDDPADKVRMLDACHSQMDWAKLEQWFRDNAKHCEALKADARKELCGKSADEAEQLLAQLQSLLNDCMKSQLPSKRLAATVASLSLAVLDLRADVSLPQTIKSETLAVSIDSHNLATSAKRAGADKLAQAAESAAIAIVEALAEVA